MKIITCEQRSPEWYAVRAGVPTCSEFDKIVTTAGDPSKQMRKYLYRLAGEKVAGMPEESYTNGAMQRGIELEAEARSLYEAVTDAKVDEVGFCMTEGDIICGCSPDGLVGDDGMIEIKCPSLAVHVEYLLNGTLPTEYFQQVHGQLYVTGRKWSDFVSYYPGLKPFILRVTPDKKFIQALDTELKGFCKELNEIVKRIQ